MNSNQTSDPRAVEGAPSPRGQVQSDSQNTSPSCRILVTPEASQSLDEALSRVTSGFDGGRIGRTQLASWLLHQGSLRLTDTDIEKIRAAHFDRVAYLEALLRRAKENGTCPPELDALFEGRSASATTKKRPT